VEGGGGGLGNRYGEGEEGEVKGMEEGEVRGMEGKRNQKGGGWCVCS
jgi:hypothetical protein